jgi:lia operon protein LiaF
MNIVFSKTFIGLLLLLFGLLFLLSNTGLIEMNLSTLLSTYWPLLLIFWGLKETIIGLLKLMSGLRRGRSRLNHLFWGSALLATGILLQGNKLEYFSVGLSEVWSWVWPILIIYIGLSFMLKKNHLMSIRKDEDELNYKESESEMRKHLVGDLKIGNEPWQLEDMQIWMGVGETDVNLTKAILPEGETILNVSGWIGEITILVPQDMDIKANVNLRLGDATLFSHQQAGSGRFLSYKSLDYETAKKKVNLRVSLAIGEVTVKWVH